MSQYFEWADEIKHLSGEQIEQLYQRYLNGEKSADLKIEFNIAPEVRSLLKILPPIISKDLTCPYCDLPMWVRRHAKGTPVSIRNRFKCVASTITMSLATMGETSPVPAMNATSCASRKSSPRRSAIVSSWRNATPRHVRRCLMHRWVSSRN